MYGGDGGGGRRCDGGNEKERVMLTLSAASFEVLPFF